MLFISLRNKYGAVLLLIVINFSIFFFFMNSRAEKPSIVRDSFFCALIGSKTNKTATHSTSEKPASIYPNRHYNYLMTARNVCSTNSKSTRDIVLLILVYTLTGNSENRKAIRETWGSVANGNNLTSQVRLAFLLALSNHEVLEQKLQKESEIHGDIIQKDFVDSYYNLTMKSIMLLEWIQEFCPGVHFVLKSDDDTYVNVDNLNTALQSAVFKTNIMYGHLYAKHKPIRNQNSKWMVTKEEYPGNSYPDFLAGSAYVMSGDVIEKLYRTSSEVPYLHLEDVFMTGLCASQSEVMRCNIEGFTPGRLNSRGCDYKWSISGHYVPPAEMFVIWNHLKTDLSVCELRMK